MGRSRTSGPRHARSAPFRGASVVADGHWAAMGGEDDDLLASAEQVSNLADPQDSLQSLVSGISQLKQQIQTVQQQQQQQTNVQQQDDEGLENVDDPYRVRTKGGVNAKEKQMSSMLLARPPATSVQDDMDRLLIRLKREIKQIETTLTAKMERVEHQIKHLPDPRPPKDEDDELPAASSRSDASASVYVESEDLDVHTSSVEDVDAPKGNTKSVLAGGSFKAAAALEMVAKQVQASDLARTIWVSQLRVFIAEPTASVRPWSLC